MNTKDFVVLPWGKPGNSVKLKYRNAHELRMEKVRLELENQEMEKKLQEFRSIGSREKEERESSGYYWKSGKVGKLGNQSYMMPQNKESVIKFSAGKVKLKLLKEQIQEPVKPRVNYKMANSSECEKPKIKGKVCGQCENKAALLVCLECGEDYCSGCFAKIHQKGALKLHRTTLLQAKSQILFSVLDVAHQFIKHGNPEEPKEENNSTKKISKNQHKPKSLLLQRSSPEVEIATTKRAECTKPRDSLLCEGSFDEEASAQSFQDVLSQWRTGIHDDKKQNLHAEKDSTEECEVQTNQKIWREPLNIELKEDILSYMEKLWLKKHRRTPQEQLFNMLPDTFLQPCETTGDVECSQNENNEDSDGEETKVQHSALLLPVETLNIERPEPSLKIVELDDTYEEECEEPENSVPYKVELADADSQQSCAFHDYQKNSFPYENDIHQHHVFNKGRRDFLSLCLRNSSTYYKDNSKAETSNTDFDNIVDPDVYSPDIEKIEESTFFERSLKQKSIGLESNQKSDESCMSHESKDTLPSIGLEKLPIEEKLSQDIKESLEFSNLHKRPSFEDSKTTKSSLLLQEIACRSKPITMQYQGLERFFIFDANERLKLPPSHPLECDYSSTRITLAEDREWIPDHSLSEHADNAIVLGVLQGAQNPSSSRKQPKTGKKLRRPSTAKFPLSNSVKESSSCLSSSHPRSTSAAAQSLSRAASEISEIEHIDITDKSELSLDDIADQHTLDGLEKELQVLRSLADLLKTSHVRGPCGVEESSSSGRDTKIQSLLSLSESSTDEEEEDFLNKQHVITLPSSKSA
ncbi:zinc finger B-box domain-containing protein 1 isoform X3 [Sapajus apella]|uniref:Zinc finger B-box domain-containing protein 1 isoform X3 n=1 Tax=Sapajus apella TaxID=9515 RepID=A0A6J3GH44_SAPAP|nr:zinc finger B-box domain-containing protein 1 isoform X3 [Sapajus apella]